MGEEMTAKMINFVYRYNRYSPVTFAIYKSARVDRKTPATIFEENYTDQKEFQNCFYNLIWLTYRKGFKPLLLDITQK